MNRIFRSLPVIAILIAVFSCSRPSPEVWDEVARAGALADFNPGSALAVLDSIAPFVDRSNDKISMFYELMRYKASDKADIPIVSDSIITPILEYYKDRSDDTLSAVALYYGGRTYSELGDAPRALDYFQKALDLVNVMPNLKIEEVIHAQLSQIYARQGLYGYSLEEDKKTLEYSLQSTDSVSILKNLTSLAESYWILHHRDSAFLCLDKAYGISKNIDGGVKFGYIPRLIASYKYVTGDLEDAKMLIDEALKSNLNSHDRILAYGTAADIYSKIDREKSRHYLNWLCDSGNLYGRKFAHMRIVELLTTSQNNDELRYHTQELLRCIDTVNYCNTVDATARAKSLYDYTLVENEKKTLEIDRYRLQINLILLGVLVLMLLGVIVILIRRYRQQKLFFNALKQSYIERTEINVKDSGYLKSQTDNSRVDCGGLYIEGANFKHKKLAEIPAVYKFLKSRDVPTLKYTSEDWLNLEVALQEIYPAFYSQLKVNGTLSEIEWRVTMLVKIGVSPNQISRITNKSSSSITSIRARLYKKTFGAENASAKDWDELVYSL